jgi:hypothetical protein
MDSRQALSQVERIREQLARAEAIRAYRAVSVAFTGAMAILGAFVQSRFELNELNGFLLLWLTVAAVCVIVVAVEMVLRCRISDSTLLRDATIVAARQFVPCVVAGALLTLVIYRHARDSVHLLPGLWAIIFSLGVFASRPGLPRAINFVGAYYLLAGLAIIMMAPNQPRFSAWPMAVSFGGGQLLTAAILYYCMAGPHDPT